MTTRSGSSRPMGRARRGSSPSPAAAASRAGRPTAADSRSCRAGAAGPRSGSSTPPCRAAVDPPTTPRPPEASVLTAVGHRRRLRSTGRPTGGDSRSWPSSGRTTSRPTQIALVDVAHGRDRDRRGRAQPRHRRAAGCPTARSSTSSRRRRLVPGRPPHARRPRPDRPRPTGEREHGEPVGRARLRARCRRPTARGSPMSRSTTGSSISSFATLAAAAPPKRGRGRPPKTPRTVTRLATPAPGGSAPGTASGARSAGSRTVRGSPRSARARPARRTCGCCRSRASRPRAPGRARSPIHVRPCSRRRWHPVASRPANASAIKARDGLRVEGTLWRPAGATGKRGGRRVPTIVYPHGGPTWQAYRELPAVQAAARARGLRVPRRRLPRFDRLRPGLPPRQPRRMGPRRRPRPHRRRALGAGAAVVGRPARDLRRLVRRLHGPVRARRGAGAVARRASTCTATRRSPRASATATGSAGSTCSG